jgi:transcriptional regulator GlxA family with amidase domain
LAVDDWKAINASNPDIEELMHKIGLVIYLGYPLVGFAVTSPFEIANQQAPEPVYDIRLLLKAGGPVRASVGFEVLTDRSLMKPATS